jgi:hypothetical protein
VPVSFEELASFGFSVFPVRTKSKQPALNWSTYQRIRPTNEEIALWDGGDYNAGVVCGSISGLLVLDVDGDEAQTLLDTLDLPRTPTVRTKRGRHYYFKLPEGDFRNSVRVADVPLDVRAEGGYVVGPGSTHPDGGTYEWEISPREAPLATLPSQVQDLIRKPAERPLTSPSNALVVRQTEEGGNRFAAWARKMLSEGVATIRHAKEGERNDTLNRVAFQIASYTVSAELPWASFELEMLAAAISVGLEEGEAKSTLESAFKAGSNQPMEWVNTAKNWVYIASRDQFYSLSGDVAFSQRAFNTMFNSQRHWEKFTISAFLTDNNLVDKVADMRFDPSFTQKVYSKDGQRWLNTYVDPAIQAEVGDTTPISDFIEYLVPNPVEREHMLRMIAWTVRNPGRKLGHALLLRSANQGVGKSTLIDIWRTMLGCENTRMTTTETINGAYQGYVDGKLLVSVEELNMAFGAQGYNRIKDLITGHTAEVNEKYIVSKERPNYATFVFLTNLANPVMIEDTDRRFFFIDTPAMPRDPSYYAEFNVWWRHNLAIIRHYLDQINLDAFNPFAPPPETEAKRLLRAASKSPLEQEIGEAIANRSWPFSRDIVTLDEVIASLRYTPQGHSVSKVTSVMQAVGAIALGQHRLSGEWLSGMGKPFFRNGNRRSSVWAVSNGGYWERAGREAVAEEYARAEGMLTNFDGLGLGIAYAAKGNPLFSHVE